MPAGSRTSPAAELRAVEAWNAAHPVGTVVSYWKGVRVGPSTGSAATRSEAQMLGGHTAVVWLEGVSGCIALTHVEAHRG
jgi:hypothetical protein